MVTGESRATGSKVSLCQILADSLQQIPHFRTETKRREMTNLTNAL